MFKTLLIILLTLNCCVKCCAPGMEPCDCNWDADCAKDERCIKTENCCLRTGVCTPVNPTETSTETDTGTDTQTQGDECSTNQDCLDLETCQNGYCLCGPYPGCTQDEERCYPSTGCCLIEDSCLDGCADPETEECCSNGENAGYICAIGSCCDGTCCSDNEFCSSGGCLPFDTSTTETLTDTSTGSTKECDDNQDCGFNEQCIDQECKCGDSLGCSNELLCCPEASTCCNYPSERCTASGCCNENNYCAFNGDCCLDTEDCTTSGCVPIDTSTSETNTETGSDCRIEDNTCIDFDACCEGLECSPNQKCKQCITTEGSCDRDNPCCEGLGCGIDATCITCMDTNQVCSSTNPCCAGLGCSFDTGRCVADCTSKGLGCDPGVSTCCQGLICSETNEVCTPCVYEGKTCSGITPCCDGYTCTDGFCILNDDTGTSSTEEEQCSDFGGTCNTTITCCDEGTRLECVDETCYICSGNLGDVCSIDPRAPCCHGLLCDDGTCATCLSDGSTCDSTNPLCCEESVCLEDTCISELIVQVQLLSLGSCTGLPVLTVTAKIDECVPLEVVGIDLLSIRITSELKIQVYTGSNDCSGTPTEAALDLNVCIDIGLVGIKVSI